MELDDWQREVLDYEGDLLVNSGRQTGKSTISAIKAAEFAVNNKKNSIIIISITEDQAQLMIIKILDYLEKNHKTKIAKGRHKPTKSKIVLTNGSTILSRPVGNTGDAVRGFTGNVLIADEAAHMPETMWKAAKPTLLSTGGQIWLFSTPRGKQGYFYESYLNKEGRFKVFDIKTEETYNTRPLSHEWTKERREKALKFLEAEKSTMSALEYGQEYQGLFLEDLRQLIPDDVISKACILKRQPHNNNNLFLGVDVARLGDDETTFEIIKKVNDNTFIQTENIIKKKQLITDTAAMITELNKNYGFLSIGIDTTGVGAGVFDILLNQPETKRKIVSMENAKKAIEYDSDKVRTSRLLKEDMYLNFVSALEKGQITLLDDEEIKRSLASVQYEYTKVVSGRTQLRIFGRYTHIVEGLIRAYALAKEKSLNIWIKSF